MLCKFWAFFQNKNGNPPKKYFSTFSADVGSDRPMESFLSGLPTFAIDRKCRLAEWNSPDGIYSNFLLQKAAGYSSSSTRWKISTSSTTSSSFPFPMKTTEPSYPRCCCCASLFQIILKFSSLGRKIWTTSWTTYLKDVNFQSLLNLLSFSIAHKDTFLVPECVLSTDDNPKPKQTVAKFQPAFYDSKLVRFDTKATKLLVSANRPNFFESRLRRLSQKVTNIFHRIFT